MIKVTLEYGLKVKRSKSKLKDFDPSEAVHSWWSDSVRTRWLNFREVCYKKMVFL